MTGAKKPAGRKTPRLIAAVTHPGQEPFGFGVWRSAPLEDVRREIAAKEAVAAKALAEVAKLKIDLRNRDGGAATRDKPRRRRVPADQICAVYDEEWKISVFGAVGRTAKRLGCSTKTVMRGLNDQEASDPALVERRYRGSRRKFAASPS